MIAPPLNDTFTLPGGVDFNLTHNPDVVYAVFPSSSANSHGNVERITYLEFGRAVHRVAHALRPGRTGKDGETIALIANCDVLTYAAIVLGIVKAGFVAYPISPRNSAAAVAHMLEKTSCHRLLTTADSLHHLMDGVRADVTAKDHALVIEEAPAIQDIFPKLGHERSEDPFTPYPSPDDSPSMDNKLWYIHSSGSTGFPKSIPHTHRSFLTWVQSDLVAHLRNYPKPLTMGLMSLPPFHGMGLIMQVAAPLCSPNMSIALFEPQMPRAPPVVPGPGNTLDVMRGTGTNAVLVVPTFIEMWAQSEEAIQFLSTLECTMFGGGPLSSSVGDHLISRGVRLVSLYGGTEFGLPVVGFPEEDDDPRDWQYMRFMKAVATRWFERGEGMYELQFLYKKEVPHVVVFNLDDVPGYATQDLFVKHPTKEGLWKIVGRLDDVLILASGEKSVPAPMEGHILHSPYVQGAIMFGRGKNQVGVLVEPHPGFGSFDTKDTAAMAEFRNRIWPQVEKANEDAPAFSRIFKEMIIVTSPDKPMLRTPKGSVMRKTTLAAYRQEIDDLYDTVENSTKTENVEPPRDWTAECLMEWILVQAQSINESREDLTLAPDVDLFSQGFDSLSATFLRNRIIGALRSSRKPSVVSAVSGVTQNFVFANPTVTHLARAVASLVDPAGAQDASHSSTDVIRQMVAKYSANIPERVSGATLRLPERARVVLTGSTGGLGSYMLAALLQSDEVERVYAMNRKSTSASLLERQEAAFVDKALPFDLLKSPMLTLVECEEAENNLGLSDDLYEQIRSSTTHIIHNAWRLNFNLGISTFEPNIRGTANLMHLAFASPYAPHLRFVFTSSVGVSQSWDKAKGPFPEEPDLPPEVAVGMGYGEAKYATEQILWNARKAGLHTTSIRIGQIAGGRSNGYWASTDWVPILVKSSVNLGAFPGSKMVVTWLPSEAIAQTVLDVTLGSSGNSVPPTLNLTNPHTLSWTETTEKLNSALVANGVIKGPLPCLPVRDWLEKLVRIAANATANDLKNIPAIKLLSFFQAWASHEDRFGETVEAGGLTRMTTAKAESVSGTLKNAPVIDENDTKSWIAYWKSKGLFD